MKPSKSLMALAITTAFAGAVQAQELLVFGFFEEVLGKIEHQELHDTLTDIIREKFRT